MNLTGQRIMNCLTAVSHIWFDILLALYFSFFWPNQKFFNVDGVFSCYETAFFFFRNHWGKLKKKQILTFYCKDRKTNSNPTTLLKFSSGQQTRAPLELRWNSYLDTYWEDVSLWKNSLLNWCLEMFIKSLKISFTFLNIQVSSLPTS